MVVKLTVSEAVDFAVVYQIETHALAQEELARVPCSIECQIR